MIEEVPTIQGDALLEEVIPDTLESDLPLPVVDESGEVQGMLSRSSLAEVLSDQNSSGGESTDRDAQPDSVTEKDKDTAA